MRSSRALFKAAIDVVTRGDKLTVAALADASGLRRQTVYLHFPDAPAVVLAATQDLLRREVTGTDDTSWPSDEPPAVLFSLAEHLAAHRSFYRRVLDGPIARPVSATIAAYFRPGTHQRVQDEFGEQLSDDELEDLTAFLLAGMGSLLEDWIVGENEETAEHAALRCWRAAHALSAVRH